MRHLRLITFKSPWKALPVSLTPNSPTSGLPVSTNVTRQVSWLANSDGEGIGLITKTIEGSLVSSQTVSFYPPISSLEQDRPQVRSEEVHIWLPSNGLVQLRHSR